MTDFYEHRVANGLLKAGLDLPSTRRALQRDIGIVADPSRATKDLWPAVWALAAVMDRQFFGQIFVDCGLDSPLPAPAPLSDKVVFRSAVPPNALRVGIGEARGDLAIYGDAGAECISIDSSYPVCGPANPITAFALAGYVGFAALARAASLPEYRGGYCRPILRVWQPCLPSCNALTFLGLGHLGQCYLALIYFIAQACDWRPTLQLVDRGAFEPENYFTQILFDKQSRESKAPFLSRLMTGLGYNVGASTAELTWDWGKPADWPATALVGFDNMESRRVAVNAGFERLIVGGLGGHFSRPRISWHDVPGQRALARVFPDEAVRGEAMVHPEVRLPLESTPGGCGWLVFNQVAAAAPSMGLVDAAFVLSCLCDSKANPVAGSALLWSQLLPVDVRPLVV